MFYQNDLPYAPVIYTTVIWTLGKTVMLNFLNSTSKIELTAM